MEIIVSHNNTDMDGLGAMVAAKKIYPEAQPVFVGKLSRNVQEFMSLHRDTVHIAAAKDISVEQVNRVILVDTKSRSRLGNLASLLDREDVEIHIYDHHPPSPEDVSGDYELISPVGATTTLLVEIIKDLNLSLNPLEATILSLGIYEDTGSLTFPTTTARDAEAVAFLLSKGAKLSVVADFIERPLSGEQQELLNLLLPIAQTKTINGVKILLASAEIDDFVGGLALLTHKLGEITGVDVIFTVVKMEDRIHMVARSRDDTVNVDQILKVFQGGGHPKAASATLKTPAGAGDIVDELLKVLKEKITPVIVAAKIMSAPVKTVPMDKTIEEAGKIMMRYGHSGFPVVDGPVMVGIISRRDIDKAKRHGLSHAPVKGFMATRIVTVKPGTPLQEIQELMIERNIGRLPVLENERLVGIISRTDVLKTLHGEYSEHNYHKVYLQECAVTAEYGSNVKELMAHNLPYEVRDLLGKISFLADQKEIRVYGVGGFIRDLLLGVENLDIDLVVEGDAMVFARDLAEFLGGRVKTHKKFATAMVILPDGMKIDLATARTEYYEYPAALPKVESSSLHQDLYRRDFTINAIAVDLSQQNFGELIDFFCSQSDLENGIIRVMYNLSFVEDPTRILRAIRFEQRYNFTMERQTLDLAKEAIKKKMLSKVSRERIKGELKHILGEAAPLRAIKRMEELKVWPMVIPGLSLDDETMALLEGLSETINFVRVRLGERQSFHPWLVYLLVLLYRIPEEKDGALCELLRLSKDESQVVCDTLERLEPAVTLLADEGVFPYSAQVKVLKSLPCEAYPILLSSTDKPLVVIRMEKYLASGQLNDLTITGDDIIKLGYKPGPLFKGVLEAVRDAKLDGLLFSREAEIEFAKRYLENRGNPH